MTGDGFERLRTDCAALPPGNAAAEAVARQRQDRLTKPPGSLGRLEDLSCWLARWQGSTSPRVERVRVVVFAGNHGVATQGVSPYPAAVTAQMVANFRAGGAAINQLAAMAGASLSVVAVNDLAPTADITVAPAMTPEAFRSAADTGRAAVPDGIDLLCLGEMGIGNTTAAAALAAGLFGGSGADWAGAGTGLDAAGIRRKAAVVDLALALHRDALGDPLETCRRLGGFELAAILGAVIEARRRSIPVLLDGFVCTAASAALVRLAADGLAHARVAHLSSERAHARLCRAIEQQPLLDLGLRLGEGSGAALAVPVLRAACACLAGMATFDEAGVSGAGRA